MKSVTLAALATLAAAPAFADTQAGLTYGVRPAYLISQMEDGALKDKLASCLTQTPTRTTFSIGHRGAPLMFPEHTVESNRAAAAMGAGVLECDVTFTADKELVCRHAQNDLHTTTNIVATDLGAKCTTPFAPASGDAKATAECRTSDLTLAEFRTLTPKMDASFGAATTAEEYLGGTAGFRTDLYADNTRLLTHADSIALFDSLGANFTPELKDPSVDMPFDGYSLQDYATAMLDDYRAAGIDPARVWPQSFNLEVIRHWIATEPEFSKQAVYLVEPAEGFDEQAPDTWAQDLAALKAEGVNYLAPSMNMLVTVGEDDQIVASAYAKAARESGLGLITWSLERSGPLKNGGGWYYNSINDVVNSDGQIYTLLDTLAQDAGVVGVFSDWPATVTYYANCMGL